MMGELVELAAWKRHPATAGAMMLLRGYCEPLTTCDACLRALERADGIIDVTFKGMQAIFPCPHCGHKNIRRLRKPEQQLRD